jgi:hypothetical protein
LPAGRKCPIASCSASLRECRAAHQVFAVAGHHVEHIVDEARGVLGGERIGEPSKARQAVPHRAYLAIDNAVVQRFGGASDFGKAMRPIQPFAAVEDRLAGADMQLDAVAVQLGFVNPLVSNWRGGDQFAELRRDVAHRYSAGGRCAPTRLFFCDGHL